MAVGAGAYEVEKEYRRLAGTVHVEAPELLQAWEDIMDDDFTFAIIGQPTWTREQVKVFYPQFRIVSAANGGPPANEPLPTVGLLNRHGVFEIPQLCTLVR